MEFKQNYKISFFIALFVLLATFSSAVPPVTTVQQYSEGYVIVEAEQSAVKLGIDFTYNFILYNSSSGNRIDDTETNCRIFIADNTGKLLFNKNVTFTDLDYWSVNITNDTFSYAGEYPYGVDCENSYGGSLAGTFFVTPTGEILNDYVTVFYSLLITILFITLIILLYNFAKTENIMVKYSFISISYILLNVLLLMLYKISESFLVVIPFFISLFKVLYTISNIGYFVFFPVLVGIIILNNLRETNINKLRQAGNSDEDISMSLNRNKRR